MALTLKEMVVPVLDRLEREAGAKGERWSVRSLEMAHGIANGTLGSVVKGERTRVTGETAKKLSRALGLPVSDLLAAEEPGDALDQTPPASSGVVVKESDAELLDAAHDGDIHMPSDVLVVERMLKERTTLMVPGTDPVQIVRRWLDAAARIRKRGEKATPSRILLELAARVVQLEEAERRPVPPAVQALRKKKKSEREA